jgi:hypothetical protein
MPNLRRGQGWCRFRQLPRLHVRRNGQGRPLDEKQAQPRLMLIASPRTGTFQWTPEPPLIATYARRNQVFYLPRASRYCGLRPCSGSSLDIDIPAPSWWGHGLHFLPSIPARGGSDGRIPSRLSSPQTLVAGRASSERFLANIPPQFGRVRRRLNQGRISARRETLCDPGVQGNHREVRSPTGRRIPSLGTVGVPKDCYADSCSRSSPQAAARRGTATESAIVPGGVVPSPMQRELARESACARERVLSANTASKPAHRRLPAGMNQKIGSKPDKFESRYT